MAYNALDNPLALSREKPELSAKTPIIFKQKAWIIAIGLVFLLLLGWKPLATAKAFVLRGYFSLQTGARQTFSSEKIRNKNYRPGTECYA